MSDLLTHEQTLKLIRAANAGDEEAKETLIIKNAALVRSIVKGFTARGAEYDDLYQTGLIGLLKAIEGYDEKYNVRFSTYAVPMIAGEIKRFLRDDGIIKVSRSLKENAVKIFRAQEKLKKELLREPLLSEISRETGLEPEEITQSLDAVREPVSIYEPVFSDGGDGGAVIADTVAIEGEEQTVIDRLLIEKLLSELSEREKKIIILRFFRDKTQSEIAKNMGVSQVQISRIITKALKKLRDNAAK